MAKTCDPGKDTCPKGFFLKSHCTATSSPKCLPCPANHFMPYVNSETSCWRCTSCNNVSLQVGRSCSPEENALCECKDGTYCTYYDDVDNESCNQCSPHKICPSGEGIVSRGTKTTNTQCKPCLRGFFSNKNSERCKPHSRCEAGVSKNGTSKTDVICAKVKKPEVPKDATGDAGGNVVVCEEGSFCAEAGAKQGSCLRCQEHSVCGPGSEVSRNGTESSDAQCRPCPAGSFSNTTSSVKTCNPHTNCSSLGMDVLIQGTASEDATCAPVFSSTRSTDFITTRPGAVPRQPSNVSAVASTAFIPTIAGAVPTQPPTMTAIALAAIVSVLLIVFIVMLICIYKYCKRRMYNKYGIYITMDNPIQRPRILPERQPFLNVNDDGNAVLARPPPEPPLAERAATLERAVTLRSHCDRALPPPAEETPPCRAAAAAETESRGDKKPVRLSADSGLGSGILNGGQAEEEEAAHGSDYNNLSGEAGRAASLLDHKENLPTTKQSSIENDVFAGRLINVTINGPVFVERNLVESNLSARFLDSPGEGVEATTTTTPLPEEDPHVPGKLVTASEYRPPPPSPTSPVTESGPLPLCDAKVSPRGGAQEDELLAAGTGHVRNHPVENESPCEYEWTTCVV